MIKDVKANKVAYSIVHTVDRLTRNLATEVAKGMTQKAVGGSTSGRAPIGYLNVRKHHELTSRGLRSLPTPKRPTEPLAVSTTHRLLTNPYCKGDVIYRGTRCKGNHPALVSVGSGRVTAPWVLRPLQQRVA